MKAKYEKPRLIIQAILLATLAGQYDNDDDDENPPPAPG